MTPNPSQSAIPNPQSAMASAAPQNILVVDDTVANLQLLAGLLKNRGYRARTVPSGKLALQAAQSEPPDLILLDINMPEMNGYEVCARLKADPQLAEIPVLFISALNETLDKVKAFGVGGVDYITKPFQFEEVEARVATHLELRRQKRALQASYQQLRELETMRDRLVHLVVHDMRSPLCALSMALEMIETETLPPELREMTDMMLKSVRQLMGMVSSLLDISKMEAGQMKLNLERQELGKLVHEAAQPLEPLKQNRQLLLSGPGTDLPVICDGEFISRVVQNLLGNAIKFTPNDGTIRVAWEAQTDGVRVTVTDNGKGIPAEFQTKIFEKFGQVETGKGRKRNSTGLGLYFCKMAVESHGGRIGVVSETGKGSTFWFELPMHGPPFKAVAS